jgi:predicted nicotinamide N-methyase
MAALPEAVDLDADILNRTPSGWPLATKPPVLTCSLGPERRLYRFRQGAHGTETGNVLWPASRLLSRYVEQHCSDFSGRSVLELGAGCALAGVTAAACGARVVLTDREGVGKTLTLCNCEAALLTGFPAPGSLSVSILDWCDHNTWLREHGVCWDWVLVADCVYHQQHDYTHLLALAQLLSALIHQPQPPRVLFSSQERDPVARHAFFGALASHRLSVSTRSLCQLQDEGLDIGIGQHPSTELWWVNAADRTLVAAPAEETQR